LCIEKCFVVKDLFKIFEVNESLTNELKVSKEKFIQMSPSLIWMSNECKQEQENHGHEHKKEKCKSKLNVYLFGALAIFIIWLISFVSVIFVGKFRKGRKFIIIALSSLAIGTLLGDALLHIIPTVRNLKKL
jgi:hypothetical protein